MKRSTYCWVFGENRSRPSSDVKRLAKEHIEELDMCIRDLNDIRDTLEKYGEAL
jgi:hypothetical protein